jgi:hypothetical protein
MTPYTPKNRHPFPMLTARTENERASTRRSRNCSALLRSDETAILRFLDEAVGRTFRCVYELFFLSPASMKSCTTNKLSTIVSISIAMTGVCSPRYFLLPCSCRPGTRCRVLKSSRRRALGRRAKSAIARLLPPCQSARVPAGMTGPGGDRLRLQLVVWINRFS